MNNAQRIEQLQAEIAELQSQVELPRRTFTANGVSFDMITCPEGKFMMGSPEDEEGRFADEKQHVEHVKSFAIGETEVTQELWEAVMGENPAHFKDPQNPIESINATEDVPAFLAKLNDMTGQRFRLLTEAEHEYAARAGTTTAFPWGDGSDEEENRKHMVYNTNAPENVKSKLPNQWGLHNMHGNTWTWTSDDWKG